MFNRIALAMLIIMGCLQFLRSQSGDFNAAILLGVNLSQIDGDLLRGYNQPGLNAGARLSYGISHSQDLSIEFLYSQKGAKESLFRSSQNQLNIRLNYVDFPLIYTLKDWFVENDKYHKIRLDFGLSPGYLFRADTPGEIFQTEIENAKNADVSWLAGVAWHFSINTAFSIRYTRSLTDLHGPTSFGTERMLNYFLSFRMEYHL
jgi:hypothetical protein